MASTRGAFSQLIAPGLTYVMMDDYGDHPEEYSQFLYVEPSDGAYDEDQLYGGLGLVRKKPESAPVVFDDPIEGGSKRYIHDSYALGWEISLEMQEDDRYDIMSKVPARLMRSAQQTIEVLGANVLNLGFTTVTTADGVSLFNTAHPLLNDDTGFIGITNGAYSNRLATDISVTSLQTALDLYENLVDHRGLRIRLSPQKLWVPPALQYIAQRTLQSGFEPGTGNNDINPVQGRLQICVLHYLTSTTRWFISGANNMHDNHCKFKWRTKFRTDVVDDFNTKGTKHSIFFRVSAGATHWPGWVGSAP